MHVLERIEAHIRENDLIELSGEVTCLVSGGPDSTCLWHAIRELGYRVRAVHVHHGLRGAEADDDAEHCAHYLGAEVVRVPPVRTEAELRELRYAATAQLGLRATGHTASDQVETVLYRLVSSGSIRGMRVRRADGVVRPLLPLWREETEAYCLEHGLRVRTDSTNPDTKRGLMRDRLLPLLDELDPRARTNLLALASERPRLPRRLEEALVELLSSREGTRAADLGEGVRAVRRYDELSLEGTVEWGPWLLESDRPGLVVRSRRPGDRLAGRKRKVQDVLVDAKVPRDVRDSWPLVATASGEVVAIPELAEAPGWEGAVRVTRRPT
ncbi:MAG: tRNA lysidine(34) synthetase TilS [Actinobacteria bacterium]|nr:tRNA lysidine(34) synthetase TilS [Actinomycetota bacterium]